MDTKFRGEEIGSLSRTVVCPCTDGASKLLIHTLLLPGGGRRFTVLPARYIETTVLGAVSGK